MEGRFFYVHMHNLVSPDLTYRQRNKLQKPHFLLLQYDFPVSALIGYRVFYRSSDSDDEQDYINEEVRDPTATSYVIHHLRPEMQYDIKIQVNIISSSFALLCCWVLNI